jgi:hypothetical protein
MRSRLVPSLVVLAIPTAVNISFALLDIAAGTDNYTSFTPICTALAMLGSLRPFFAED